MLTIEKEKQTAKERLIKRINLQKEYLDILIEECDNVVKYGHKTPHSVAFNTYEKNMFVDLGIAFKTFMSINGNKMSLRTLIVDCLELPYVTISRIIANENIMSARIVTVENLIERVKEVSNTRYEVIMKELENVE